MPLTTLPYSENYGEWFPYDGSNYSDRARAMFFMQSANSAVDVVTTDIEFSNNIPSSNREYFLPNTLPLIDDTDAQPRSKYLDSQNLAIYTITLVGETSHIEVTIRLFGPFSKSTYRILGLSDNVFNQDDALYQKYKNALIRGLVDDESLENVTDIYDRIEKFQWGEIEALANFGEPTDQGDRESIVGDFISYNFIPRDDNNPTSREEVTIKFKISLPQINGVDSSFLLGVSRTNDLVVEGTIMDLNPEYSPVTTSGDFLIPSVGGSQFGEFSYLDLSNDLGRYQVLENTALQDSRNALLVKRVDGLNFPTPGTETGITIRDITHVPKIRMKYRRVDNPSTGIFYKIFSKQDAGNYITLTNPTGADTSGGSPLAESKLVSTTNGFIDQPETTPGIISIGGAVEIDMGDGSPNIEKLGFGLNTTLDIADGIATRITPWRKAYRFISRFRPKSVDIHQVKTVTPNPFNGVVQFKVTQGTARSRETTDNVNHTYPLAISHRPPCMQHINPPDASPFSRGRGTIIVDYDFDNGTLLSGTFRQDEVTGEYLFAGNGDHFIEEENNGYIFEENGLPNSMSFQANLNDTYTAAGYDYDYTGLVSCRTTVIPAYSGEILYFDTDHGFVKNNYTNPDIGITNRLAVFIDITETDEVLRWNGNNYSNPHEFWRDTFTQLTIKNKTTGEPLVSLANYAVLLTNKDNYVVVMYANAGESLTINDGDEIEIIMRNKKTLVNWNDPNIIPNPNTAEYETLAYRNVTDEWIDDHRNDFSEPTLRDFTISSDGTVDGTITINYDGDVPEGTEFRLYIQDDDTTP